MRLPDVKEIQRLANQHIKCTFKGGDAIRPRWKVLTVVCAGDPRRAVYVYAILQCKWCRVKTGVRVTCRRQGYGIKEILKTKKAA